MTVTFECPTCSNQLKAKLEYVGRGGKCKCGSVVIIPGHPEKMKFTCTQCGKAIVVSNRHAGKQGRCPLCKDPITVPQLGIPLQTRPTVSPPAAQAPAVPADPMVIVKCNMCGQATQRPQSHAGMLIECKECGSFMEVPGQKSAGVHNEPQTAQTPEPVAGPKIKCPSCEGKLAADSPICPKCGIYVKSGRPILTAWDIDPDEVDYQARRVVSPLSWVIPFGIYPVCSEAMGNNKPYVTWAITAITVLISLWFLVLEYSGSEKMVSAKNLMLWSSNTSEPDPDQVFDYYNYTSYGDSDAFFTKLDELNQAQPHDKRLNEPEYTESKALFDEMNLILPNPELVMAAHNALPPAQQCFGSFKWYQLITHAFLHAGILHLAGNMLFLIVFGLRVNEVLGNIITAILYPILAIAAAMSHLMSIGGQPPMPMLGASGAVMGLAGAYLLLFPAHKVYMVIWMRWGLLARFHLSFKTFAVRGFWVVLFYIMFDIIAVSLMLDSGTAHWAHIGGLIWGFVIAFGLIVARLAYSRNDMLSMILGKYAWKIIGSPATRMD